MNPQMTIRFVQAGQALSILNPKRTFDFDSKFDSCDDDDETHDNNVIPKKRKRLTHLTQEERMMRRYTITF